MAKAVRLFAEAGRESVRAVYGQVVVAALTSLATYAASTIKVVADQGWPAVILVGVIVGSVVALAFSFAAIAYRLFWPAPDAPEMLETRVEATPALPADAVTRAEMERAISDTARVLATNGQLKQLQDQLTNVRTPSEQLTAVVQQIRDPLKSLLRVFMIEEEEVSINRELERYNNVMTELRSLYFSNKDDKELLRQEIMLKFRDWSRTLGRIEEHAYAATGHRFNLRDNPRFQQNPEMAAPDQEEITDREIQYEYRRFNSVKVVAENGLAAIQRHIQEAKRKAAQELNANALQMLLSPQDIERRRQP